MLGFLAELYQPFGLIVPVVGLLVSVGAFWLGWRLLSPPRPGPPEVPNEREFLKGVTLERRATRRRKGNTVQVLLRYPDREETLLAWVIDRSQGGLCLLVEQPVAVDTVLMVRPRNNDDPAAWVRVIVRSCRSAGIQHEIGVQFQQMPNWSLLLQFG
ncbi:MAG: PilZ domain-containing protein [Gemmataceae bacterium]